MHNNKEIKITIFSDNIEDIELNNNDIKSITENFKTNYYRIPLSKYTQDIIIEKINIKIEYYENENEYKDEDDFEIYLISNFEYEFNPFLIINNLNLSDNPKLQLTFDEKIKILNDKKSILLNNDNNKYFFEIDSTKPEIIKTIKYENSEYKLFFEIPKIQWQLEGLEDNIVWYNEMKKYFIWDIQEYQSLKLRVFLPQYIINKYYNDINLNLENCDISKDFKYLIDEVYFDDLLLQFTDELRNCPSSDETFNLKIENNNFPLFKIVKKWECNDYELNWKIRNDKYNFNLSWTENCFVNMRKVCLIHSSCPNQPVKEEVITSEYNLNTENFKYKLKWVFEKNILLCGNYYIIIEPINFEYNYVPFKKKVFKIYNNIFECLEDYILNGEISADIKVLPFFKQLQKFEKYTKEIENKNPLIHNNDKIKVNILKEYFDALIKEYAEENLKAIINHELQRIIVFANKYNINIFNDKQSKTKEYINLKYYYRMIEGDMFLNQREYYKAKEKYLEALKLNPTEEVRDKLSKDELQYIKIKINIVDDVNLEMVLVEAGKFMMGSHEKESGRYSDERQHTVKLTKDYYIGKYPVTQAQWQSVMRNNPSCFKDANRPVERVSWNDVQEFIKNLNQMTGKNFRLPTEAEWEFAARGGKKSKKYKYSGSNNIDEVAWYGNNSGDEPLDANRIWMTEEEEYVKILEKNRNQTHPVGQKKPNELGIYDMSGNVLEWCSDWYEDYQSGNVTDPIGAETGRDRVIRGGGWHTIDKKCRVSFRCTQKKPNEAVKKTIGFRLCLPAVR